MGYSDDPIVISGIGGRFPESRDADEFWSNLLSGKELYTENDSRWPIGHLGLPKRSGKIPDIAKFDASFFGFDDKEADDMDPQFKVCHETTFESIVDAGLDPVNLRGDRTGMFIGYCYNDARNAQSQVDATVNKHQWAEDFSEVSKSFGFKGPCMTYDSACASSFSALNEAINAIRVGLVDTAILAGVAICTTSFVAAGFRQLGMTSAEAKSRCMDKKANGYVRSETVACVVLQRKSVSKRIYAIVVHSKTNSDGFKKEGITFPGKESMTRLMAETYVEAGLDPKSIKYIEAHVTGTQAGDPIECGAIEKVFCPDDRTGPVLLGCLKSNMGHAEGASGVAAVAKACMILQRNLIPPNINYDEANPNIKGLFNGKLKPVLAVTPFNGDTISLNSFGFGGSNIHTIFRSYDEHLNHDTKEIRGIAKDNTKMYRGINRLILFKSRTEEGFKLLEKKIRMNPNQITTEFLDLINNVANLDPSFDLPYRGYLILDPFKKIVRSEFKFSTTIKRKPKCNVRIKDVKNFTLYKDILAEAGINVVSNGTNALMEIDSTATTDDILAVIGKLYIDHYEVNIRGLYPLVRYPVSRKTASIAPLIKWNHEKNWTVYKVPDFFKSPLENKRFHFDYSSTHSHLAGHVIDGRIIFPAAQYLWLIWESLAYGMVERSINAFLQTGVKFWNVKLHRAVIVNRGDELNLWTSVNPVTGFFEILHGDACVVTGYALLTYDEAVPSVDDKNQEADENERIAKKDFYKELRVRGYDYEDYFQGVNYCYMDGTGGQVSFLKNWVCFTDALFQLALISDPTRSLLLPTGFEYLQVDANVFKNISQVEYQFFKNILKSSTDESADSSFLNENSPIKEESVAKEENVSEEEKIFDVTVRKDTMEIISRGLYIKGMKANPAPRKKAVPLVAKFFFCPFDEDVCDEDAETKSAYIDECLTAIKSSDAVSNNKNLNKTKCTVDDSDNDSDPTTDDKKPLLQVIKKLLKEGKQVSPVELKQQAQQLSADPLLSVPIQQESFKHQFKIISDSFYGQSVNVTEVNLSSKSVVQDQVEIVLNQLCPGVSYNLFDSNHVGEDDKPDGNDQLIKFFDQKSTESQVILIQHPSLGFSFLDESTNGDQQFTEAIQSSADQLKPGAFLMVVARNKKTRIEEQLAFEGLMSESPKAIRSLVRSNGFTVISTKNIGDHTTILARKVVRIKTTPKVVEVETFNYDWVDELRNQLFIEEDGAKKPVNDEPVIVLSKERNSGLTGFMNCVRYEDRRLRGIQIIDENFDQAAIIEKCLDYDLMMTIYKDGKLGTLHSCKISDDGKVISNESKATDGTCYCLDVETKGDLSSLKYYKRKIKSDPRNLIDVHYSALNFKDIMVASGRVPLTAYPKRLQKYNAGNLGMEFSGTDCNGNRVMGLCENDAIATSVSFDTATDICFNVPNYMSLEEAATIPVVYTTVYYALIMRGKLLPGETILIHAGSGGVGQAAINVCLSMGCKIFTTVGTKEKRDFITKTFPSITDDRIFDSRNVSFGDDVLRATDGHGVDVVINSLSEEKLQTGLNCLAPNGRFIEIGKYDLVIDSKLDPTKLTHNQTYQAVCLRYFLDKVSRYPPPSLDPEIITLRKLFDQGLKEKVIKPLSRHVFEWNQAEEAFRFMATGKHLGKVLIRMRDEKSGEDHENVPRITATQTRVSFDADKSFIVVGGLGGMGLEICHWLVSKGVRTLIITSRTGMRTAYHRFFVGRMKEFGADVMVKTNNVSNYDEAEELIGYAESIKPVGGIFNLGMVLKDSMFENQTKELFEEACGVKIKGSNNLDILSREMCPQLEHFVCFSSLVSTVGNAGQSNYAFANSFMDSLCARRKSQGLPALSIGWGAIGDVGHVAENIGNDVVIAGSIPQRINSCFDVLDRTLFGNDPIVGSMVPVDRSKFEAKGDIVATILNVLGIKDHKTVHPKSTLGDLGLDSLMAVEIKQILEKKYEKVLSTKQVRELTIEQIREFSASACVDASKLSEEQLLENTLPLEIKLPSDVFRPLNEVTSGEPVFLFPPMEGSFTYLLNIVKNLTTKLSQPIIGVNWVEENDDQESVEQVAEWYINQLNQKFEDVKSYHFIAYSFGSLIAMDIALQLQNKNADRRVSNLVVLDFSPSYARPYLKGETSPKSSEDGNNFLQLVTDYYTSLMKEGKFDFNEKITSVPSDEKIQKYYQMVLKSYTQYKECDWIGAIDRIRLKIKMTFNYDPRKKLNQDIFLIRATAGFTPEFQRSMTDDYEMSKNVSGTIKVVKLDGDHKTFLVKNCETISNEISCYINSK